MYPTLRAAGFAVLTAAAAARAGDASCWVYFGTSATDARRGIYFSRLDQDSGSLSPAVRVADRPDSVFLAFAPDRRHLYSLAEVPGPEGGPVEAIETYAVDAASGRLAGAGEPGAGAAGPGAGRGGPSEPWGCGAAAGGRGGAGEGVAGGPESCHSGVDPSG